MSLYFNRTALSPQEAYDELHPLMNGESRPGCFGGCRKVLMAKSATQDNIEDKSITRLDLDPNEQRSGIRPGRAWAHTDCLGRFTRGVERAVSAARDSLPRAVSMGRNEGAESGPSSPQARAPSLGGGRGEMPQAGPSRPPSPDPRPVVPPAGFEERGVSPMRFPHPVQEEGGALGMLRQTGQRVWAQASPHLPLIAAISVAALAVGIGVYASSETFTTTCFKEAAGKGIAWCGKVASDGDMSQVVFEKYRGVNDWVPTGEFVTKSIQNVQRGTPFDINKVTEYFVNNPLVTVEKFIRGLVS